jgi:hypothetical protein
LKPAEQERQHALHQRPVEVDAGQELAHGGAEPGAGQQPVDADHGERGERAHDRQADGLLQPDEAVVQIAEPGRQNDQEGGGVQGAHGALSRSGDDGDSNASLAETAGRGHGSRRPLRGLLTMRMDPWSSS